jgi:DNA-binding GntR family transcriptional regulator
VKKSQETSDLQLKLARQIITLIGDKALPAGTHLKELELADKFNVSRSPVRATLDYLETLNLVERRENRGFFLKKSARDCEGLPFNIPKTEDDKICELIAKDWFENNISKEISETEIRKRYSLGRLTASKILQKLTDQGVVSRQPGYGWRFEPTLNSSSAHDESYDFRILTESRSILLPTFKLNNAAAERLRERHNLVLNSRDTGWDISELFKLDVDFHKFIAECSGNRFIIDAIERQNKLRRLVEYMSLIDTGRLADSCLEHLQILDALQGNKAKLASHLMAEHLQSAKALGPSYSK